MDDDNILLPLKEIMIINMTKMRWGDKQSGRKSPQLAWNDRWAIGTLTRPYHWCVNTVIVGKSGGSRRGEMESEESNICNDVAATAMIIWAQ